MKFNEADQEIFDEILSDFINDLGEEQSHKIIEKIYRLHRRLSNKLGKNNLPIAYIYRTIIKKKMKEPIETGGYNGLPIKEIYKRESLSLRKIYELFHEVHG